MASKFKSSDLEVTTITLHVCGGDGQRDKARQLNESKSVDPSSPIAQSPRSNSFSRPFYSKQNKRVILEAVDLLPKRHGDETKREGQDSPNVILLVTPGNPGVISYYKTYLREMFEGFDGRHRVLGVGQAGHSKDDLNNGEVFSLEDHVRIRIALVEHLLREKPNAKFVLFGHSVGAYLNMQVETRCPHLPIFHTQLLFPTIHRLNIPLTVSIGGHQWVLPIFKFVIRCLPESVKWGVARFFMSGGAENEVRLALEHIHQGMVANVLHMAKCEEREINELESESMELLKSRLHQTTWVFTEDDPYVSLESYKTLCEYFPNADMTMYWKNDEDVKHAFVLENSEQIARFSVDKARPHIDRHLESSQGETESVKVSG